METQGLKNQCHQFHFWAKVWPRIPSVSSGRCDQVHRLGLTQQTLALTGLAAGRLCQGAGLGGFLGRPLAGSVLTQPSLWPRSRPLLIQRESPCEGLTSAAPPPRSPSSRNHHPGDEVSTCESGGDTHSQTVTTLIPSFVQQIVI